MMKKIIFGIALVIGLGSAVQAQEIGLDSDVVDFGQIKKGEKAQITFTVKNTGDQPLIISKATASCGCTVPSYPQTPIAPGKTAEIEVQYTAVNHPGTFSKTVTIMSNAKENARKIVRVKGEVVE